MSGKARVVMKPTSKQVPFVGGLQFSFLEIPRISFNVDGIADILDWAPIKRKVSRKSRHASVQRVWTSARHPSALDVSALTRCLSAQGVSARKASQRARRLSAQAVSALTRCLCAQGVSARKASLRAGRLSAQGISACKASLHARHFCMQGISARCAS